MVISKQFSESKMSSVSFKVDPEYAKISEIIPGLFICGVTALKREILDRYGISFIINATTEVINCFKSRLLQSIF